MSPKVQKAEVTESKKCAEWHTADYCSH